ncbi:glycine receptor subunit alpha-4 like protein [Danaus plexippus plexippus]|uniref:Glycine receptor subunit alpha-4 like protein n=1 Tax=Danaus plexippus plexippus TaxID=278856 RepID=A0A212EXF6_DANPL|nr:glycine receptor subunit alpha-4 like protein [Danaus plexippus plexippus]
MLDMQSNRYILLLFSVSHTVHDLVFIWNLTDPLVVNPDIELPQLDIANNFTSDCTIEYSTGNFTCLAVVFNLRRRLGYHLFHTYIPSALIVVMSWISFWIKPEAIPARVTLGVTSLLTLGNLHFYHSVDYIYIVTGVHNHKKGCMFITFKNNYVTFIFLDVQTHFNPCSNKYDEQVAKFCDKSVICYIRAL